VKITQQDEEGKATEVPLKFGYEDRNAQNDQNTGSYGSYSHNYK